jgi:hypothetical protein
MLAGCRLPACRTRLTGPAIRLLGAAVLLVSVVFALLVLPVTVQLAMGDYLAFSDFFAQWSFALVARTDDVARIYDAAALHRFQLTLEPALRQFFPYPYPPSYLFILWPLGWMPFPVAYLVWDIATLALFLWAVFGTRLRTPMLAFVVLAPVTVIALSYGQNGLLSSALIVGGLRLMGPRPVAGGVLLGLATFKPQLGVLIPLALIGAGRWRTLGAAGATAALLVVASGWAFGWALWPAWLDAIGRHAAYVEHAVNNYLKPTLMANLLLFGVAPPVAHAVQAGAAVGVAGVVWLCFRRGATGLSLAALQVGTFLAVPFVFRYDMPMLANAVLLVVRDRQQAKQQPGLIEAAIIMLGLLFPVVVTLTSRFFYFSGMALILLFALIVWRRLGSGAAARAGRSG